MSNQNRHPQGVPTGGQFAVSARAEAETSLVSVRTGAEDRPLVSARAGLPRVRINEDGEVEVFSFACEIHEAPGRCTADCARLLADMSVGVDVDYDPTGTSYGPPRPIMMFDFDETERACVEITTVPEGQTIARAVLPGDRVVLEGQARTVDSVTPTDDRGSVWIDFESCDREPDGTPTAYLSVSVRADAALYFDHTHPAR